MTQTKSGDESRESIARMIFEEIDAPLLEPWRSKSWAKAAAWDRDDLTCLPAAEIRNRCLRAVDRLRAAGILVALLILSACATPVHVVAPTSTGPWTCDEEPEPPDRRGHGFIGPGKVTARDGLSTAEIPNGYGVSVDDWHSMSGYITRLTKAYCACRLVVDSVNRRMGHAAGPRAMCGRPETKEAR